MTSTSRIAYHQRHGCKKATCLKLRRILLVFDVLAGCWRARFSIAEVEQERTGFGHQSCQIAIDSGSFGIVLPKNLEDVVNSGAPKLQLALFDGCSHLYSKNTRIFGAPANRDGCGLFFPMCRN